MVINVESLCVAFTVLKSELENILHGAVITGRSEPMCFMYVLLHLYLASVHTHGQLALTVLTHPCNADLMLLKASGTSQC